MGLEFDYVLGQTPLDPEEIDGLRIDTIATRSELDEFEQQHIEQAMQWILTRSFKTGQVLTETFICQLHKRMYGEVWAWAGDFRKTNKNIGVDHWKIGTELRYLLDDTLYWIANDTYPSDEIALRFKHRLVSIHCFPNGNGRHSRLMADIIINKIFKQPVFSWGTGDLIQAGNARAIYIDTVKAADKGDLHPLLDFSRS